MSETMSDLGERKIISSILAVRYGRENPDFGSDCAAIWLPMDPAADGVWIIASTDPCPYPAAWLIGERDYYYWGWLLATINLSDLAASGSRAIGLLTSFVLSSSTTIDEFSRLLDGLDDCCAASGVRVIGGNLKEGPAVDMSATILGVCTQPPLTRQGASVGDEVYVFGKLGAFWAAMTAFKEGIALAPDVQERLRSRICTPVPLLNVGQRLRDIGVASACMDNSDGLFPTVTALVGANGADLDFDSLDPDADVRHVASVLGADWRRWAFGWGDWQLVVTARPDSARNLLEVAEECSVPLWRIGVVVERPGVYIMDGAAKGPALPLDSERFSKDSWLSVGVQAYIDAMMTLPFAAEVSSEAAPCSEESH